MTFMLDTDTVSLILRDEGETATHFRATPRQETCISSLTLGELRRGVALRQSRRLAALVDTFVSAIRIASFGAEAAGRFGTLAANLSRRGVPIGVFDTLIAAHALAVGAVIVTHNRRHFDRVDGLEVVDWHS